MVTSSVSLQVGRIDVVDFLYPFRFDMVQVLYKSEHHHKKAMNLIIRPLHWGVWFCIGASTICLASIVWAFGYFLRAGSDKAVTFSESLGKTLGTTLGQGK